MTHKPTGKDKTMSRAREVEDKRGVKGRVMSRGRSVLLESKESIGTPADSTIIESDEEGLGGYGFFDAGMLLSALKSSKEEPKEKATQKRNIGRILRVNDY